MPRLYRVENEQLCVLNVWTSAVPLPAAVARLKPVEESYLAEKNGCPCWVLAKDWSASATLAFHRAIRSLPPGEWEARERLQRLMGRLTELLNGNEKAHA